MESGEWAALHMKHACGVLRQQSEHEIPLTLFQHIDRQETLAWP